MRITAALPTGMAALLFDAARRRREMEGRMAGELAAAGYSEVILPVLDYLEPYEPILSSASRGELYSFVGRGGELLALRSDFTPMLARLLAPRLPSLELPLRLFYRGDVVRYQDERAGRQREFYQVGAELLGAGDDAGSRDAGPEVLRVFLRLLSIGDARPIRVVLGFAGALDEVLLGAAGEAGAELAAALARRERRQAGDASRLLHRLVETGLPEDPAELGAGGWRGPAGGAPITTAWSSAPTPASADCRWERGGATTASFTPSAPRCRRPASRSISNG